MKKGTTVYEDKAAKEEARRRKEEEYKKKRQAQLEKHAVPCSHCGKSVLDHMTKCPYCGGELTPYGYYKPMDEKKRKKIKLIGYIVGFVIAAALIVVLIVTRK